MDLALLFFGIIGSHNNIKMLHRSLAFSRLVEGNDPVVHYEINGNAYDKSCYLADDIYPR
jgi:hypothetical protein